MNKLLKYYRIYGASVMNRARRCAPEKRSIFIAKFDGLGDFFLLLPLLGRLIEKGYRVSISGSPFQKEIIDHCGLPVRVVPFRAEPAAALRVSLAAVRTLRPELAINLSMNVWGGILVNATRAPMMIGLLQEREWYVYKGTKFLFDRRVSYEPSLHSFEANRRLLDEAAGIGEVEPFFQRPGRATDTIVVHPYCSWLPRRWPYFDELIERLSGAGLRCAVIGTAAEHEQGGTAARVAGKPCCSTITLDSIGHLLTAIESCRVFIGNDSGPAHYAGLIGKPTFVLWGPGNFGRIRQLGRSVYFFKKDFPCSPCRQRGETCTRGNNECLKSISVSEVFSTVMEKIGTAGGSI